MQLNNRLTLLISSCEKFSDLWNLHFHFLNLHWKNRDLDTFLVTDKKTKIAFENINVKSVGNLEMPKRLEKALAFVKTKYVLLTLDDYFLIKDVDEKQIEEIIDFMDSYSVDYCRLYPINKERKKVLKENKWLFKVNLEKEYAVNLYPGIWRVDFLLKTFCNDTNIWNYEVSLTKTAKACKANCIMSRRNEFSILDVIRKGKVLHKAHRYLEKRGFSLDNRELVSWGVEIRYFVFGFFSHILPSKIKKIAKGLLRKFGVKFYSE